MVLFQQNFNQMKKNWSLNQSRIDTIMSRGTGIIMGVGRVFSSGGNDSQALQLQGKSNNILL